MQQNQGKIIFKKKYSDKFLWLSEEIMLPLLQSVSGIWQQKTQNKPCQSALCATDSGSLNGLGKMEGFFFCFLSVVIILISVCWCTFYKGVTLRGSWCGVDSRSKITVMMELKMAQLFTVNKRINIWDRMDYFKCLIKKSYLHNTWKM